ncbi:MAG: hypothetical protein HY819_19465 [Acidobacteria bacterium]|nr:hypothetical protein [Acidobacteriota bacterium]
MFRFRFKKPFFVIFFIFFIFLFAIFSLDTTQASRPFNPFLAGNSIGEPTIDLGSVVVEGETLNIDLRELVNFKRSQMIEFTSEYSPRLAFIETLYKIRNDKAPQNITLTFFGDIMSFTPNTKSGVWLNDQAVVMENFDPTEKDLPINWGIPNFTPSVNGNWRIPYRPLIKSPIVKFNLEVPTGTHTLKVAYFAQPSTYLQGEETIPWQFVYVLTPARDWVGFSNLDTTIYIPKGWQFSSNVKLTAEGEMLKGSWQSLPANSLSLTIQIPSPNFFKLGILAWLIGLALCLSLGNLTGKLLRRYKKSLVLAMPISFILGIIWVLLVFFLVSYDQNHLKFLVGENQLARPNNSFVKIASLPFAFTLGVALTQITAFFSHRNIVENKS